MSTRTSRHRVRASDNKSDRRKYCEDRDRAIRKSRIAKCKHDWRQDCEKREAIGLPIVPWPEYNMAHPWQPEKAEKKKPELLPGEVEVPEPIKIYAWEEEIRQRAADNPRTKFVTKDGVFTMTDTTTDDDVNERFLLMLAARIRSEFDQLPGPVRDSLMGTGTYCRREDDEIIVTCGPMTLCTIPVVDLTGDPIPDTFVPEDWQAN